VHVQAQNNTHKPQKYALEVRTMTKNLLKTFFVLFFLSITLLLKSQACPAQSGNVPIIHISETNHVFSTVFEGENLSHAFTILNKGTANLNINRVTPS